MPEYLAPGVYVEEVDTGSRPIEGVSTSTAGMVGFTERGPEDAPMFVTSFAGFQRTFGGFIDHRPAGYNAATHAHGLNVAALPYAVEGFFLNGGQRLYVTRVASQNAVAASLPIFGLPDGVAANATLGALAEQNANSIVLDQQIAIDEANWLLIEDGERSEHVQPNMAGGQVEPVVIRAGLNFGHDPGRAVRRMEETPGAVLPVDAGRTMAAGASELAVDDATQGDLAADQVIRITNLDNPAQVEYAVVNADDNRTIRGSFRFDYNVANVEMRSVTLAAVAGDAARTIVAPAPAAGATAIPLNNMTGIQPGGILSIEGNTVDQTEFQIADAIRFRLPLDVSLVGGLRAPHAAGVSVVERRRLMTIEARDSGKWGNQVRVTLSPGSVLATTVSANFAANAPFITLASTLGIEAGTRLEIQATNPVAGLVQRVEGNNVFLAGGLSGDVETGDAVSTSEFNMLVERLDENGRVIQSEVEAYQNLSIAPTHSRYAGRIIGRVGRASGESNLVRIVDDDAFDPTGQPVPAANERPLPETIESGQRNGRTLYLGLHLVLGDDAVNDIDEAAYYGADNIDPDQRTGLQSFKNVDEISIVAIPGITTQEVQERLILHCTEMRYRFAVLDAADGAKMEDVQRQRSLYDTRYAALYYPWAMIGDLFDPTRKGVVAIPPSGHIVGLYARTDVERGVHKAPANEVLRNVRDLQIGLNKAEQDILNPRNINVIRDFRSMNRGLRVWGARTLTSDSSWKYVNVRRLFLFVEKSIELGTQWVVFEPNDEPLWKRVHRSVANFLTSVWRDGALQGTRPEEAFFVKVDRTTMTQDDIDNGRLIVLVGIAPVKPAEFVIFRISQFTAESLA